MDDATSARATSAASAPTLARRDQDGPLIVGRVTVDDDSEVGTTAAPPGEPFCLERAVASLYADLRLTPMLHTLLAHSRTLLDGLAGSISVIDPDAGTYRKLAERGVSCRLGATFPLDEGATGQAVARRRPVVFEEYSAVAGRHLLPEHPANRGSVAAVPIWWRGEVIGVNVAFVGRRQHFTTAQIDRLEVLTQTAAGAILSAGAGEPSLTRFTDGHRLRDHDPVASSTVTALLGETPTAARAGRAVAALLESAERAGQGCAGSVPTVDPAARRRELNPLTAREAEVLAMVALGLSDREIARRLVLSPKTVEKHVGSGIRKTGTTSRTGAAVRSLERGWI